MGTNQNLFYIFFHFTINFLLSRCSKERPHQKAPRAGTPGFRPPEVLLKSAKQNTAVDLWAAGIVFLCMLARSYPFFR